MKFFNVVYRQNIISIIENELSPMLTWNSIQAISYDKTE